MEEKLDEKTLKTFNK